MTLDSVCAVPALPRFDPFAGLIPTHDGEVILHYRESLQTTVFVRLDGTGTPRDPAPLDVNSPDYAFVDDRTLVGISAVAPPDTTLPIRPPRRTVSSKMVPMKLVYIDTDTWTIERKVTVELPEDAINGLQLIAPR